MKTGWHQITLLLFSHSVAGSDSLRSHGLQHTRLPCPSLYPRVCSNSCPLCWWCPRPSYLLPPPSPPALSLSWHQVFSNELALCIRWPEDWSFRLSISLSNEYSELVSFRMYWLDLLAVQGTLKISSSTTFQKHQFFGFQHSLRSNSHIQMTLINIKGSWISWVLNLIYEIRKLN